MSEREITDLGDLDGEPFAAVNVSIRATGAIPRRPADGERCILIVEGTLAGSRLMPSNAGRLVRVHKLTVDRVAEPTADIAGEMEEFLRVLKEAEDGQTSIDGALGDGDDDPEDE